MISFIYDLTRFRDSYISFYLFCSQSIKINSSYISALIICAVSGTSYLFGAYSTELVDKLEFNSVELNIIGSAANYGSILVVLSNR